MSGISVFPAAAVHNHVTAPVFDTSGTYSKNCPAVNPPTPVIVTLTTPDVTATAENAVLDDVVIDMSARFGRLPLMA